MDAWDRGICFESVPGSLSLQIVFRLMCHSALRIIEVEEMLSQPFTRRFRSILNLIRLLAWSLLLIGLRRALAQDALPSSSSAAGVMPVTHADAGAEDARKPHGSNVLAYWFGSIYRTPFVLKPNTFKAADIQRHSLEFTHVDFWKMGSNFADVMVNQSDKTEPAAGGGTGATEVYVTLRSDLGLNEITHSQTFRTGPLRDLAIEVGANLEAKNSAFAPAERTLYVGPKFQLALPKGYFNIGLHLRQEWNHEGVLGKSENYDELTRAPGSHHHRGRIRESASREMLCPTSSTGSGERTRCVPAHREEPAWVSRWPRRLSASTAGRFQRIASRAGEVCSLCN
jgi:hypothetical protein